MLIEQIIEFELKGPWPTSRTCSPTTRNFHDKKRKFLRKIFGWIIIYC